MALQVPSSSNIQFNDDTIREAAKGARLPEGCHFFVVKKAEIKVSEGKPSIYGTLGVNLQVAALADPVDVTSTVRPLMYTNVFLPFNNPNVPGHVAPDWTPGMAARALRAMFDTLPLPPHREGEVYMYAGEEIDPESIEDAKADALKAVYEQALKVLADPTSIVGKAFYGLVGESKGFWGIQEMWRELPADRQLVDLSGEKRIAAKAPAADAAKKKKTTSKKGK